MKKATPAKEIKHKPQKDDSKSLRVLLIEDNEDDALLVLRELKKGGFNLVYERVETAAAMKKALKEGQWDIILSDYKLPKFDGIQAINLLRETQLDIPLIIVSGTIGEETAVECMKAGARDYVMKNNLSRLCQAIKRELKEALNRAMQRQAEENLFKSQLLLNETQQIAGVGGWEYDVVNRRVSWTDEVYRIYGVSNDFDPNNIEQDIKFYSPGDQKIIDQAFRQVVKNGIPYDLELKFINARGNHLWVQTTGKAEKKQGKIVRVFGYIQDITERKKAEDEFLREVEQVDLLKKRLEFAMSATHTNTNIIDADFNLLYVDEQWQNIYGNPEGKKCHKYFMGTDKMCPTCAIPQALKTKKTVVSEEILAKENNRIVEVHTIPFQEADGTWKVFEFNIDITRRKQAEEKLKLSEDRLDRAMAVKNEGLWDWDTVTNETFFDERYYTMAGYAPNEFPQTFTAWAQHVHPDDLPGANTAIQDYLSGKAKNFDIEFRFQHKKGSWIWIRGQGKIIEQDAKGKPLRIIGTHTDITERKMVEENFRRSIDDSPLGVRISSKQAETIYANKAILDMYGYKNFEEFKNTPVKDRYTPQSYSEYLLRSKERKQGELGRSEYEISIIRKNGEVRHLRAFRKEILWNGEKQAQIIYMDITERKQAQEKLQQSEENFRLTFNSTSDVIFTLDTQLRLHEITPSVEKVLGYKAEELNGKSFPSLNIMSPESREKASLHVGKILSGKYAPPAVYEFILKDGRKGFGEITASPIIKENKIIGVTCVSRDITERLKTEAERQGALVALRESEEKYRTILENIEDGYYEVDLAGNLTFFNDSVCRISGYEREELMGMNNRQYTAPENIKEILKTFHQVYATGIPAKGFDWKTIKKDGEKRSFEASVSLMKDLSKKPTGFRGIIRDITERKKAQEKLRQSEENYRSLFDNAKEGILIVQNEKINFANPALVEILGYPIDIIKNKPFKSFIHPEDSEKVLDNHQRRLRGEDVETNYDFRIITGDGAEKWLRIKSQIISWNGLPSSLSFIEDITAQKTAREELLKSEEKYRTILSNMQEGYFETDLAGSLTFVNDAMWQNLGYSKEEIIGLNFRQYTDEKTARELYQVYNHIYTTGNPVQTAGFEFTRKNATKVFVETSASLIRDKDGKPLGFRGVSRDITARRQAEELLKIRMNLMEYSLTHSLGELLQKTLDEICALTGSLIGFYHFVETDQKTLSLQAWSTRTLEEFCKAEGYGMHYNIDQAGVWVDCLRKGQPVIHNDYAYLPHRKGLPEGHAPVIRELAVPISRKGLFVAVLGVGNKPQDYTENDIEIVSYLADVAYEIAGRKKVEDALRHSEEKYRLIFEHSPMGLLYFDKNGVIVACNDTFVKIIGSSHEALIGLNMLNLPDKGIVSAVRQALSGSTGFYEDIYHSVTAPKITPVRALFAPMNEEGDIVQGGMGIIEDVTQQKKAQEAIKQSEEKYRSLVENAQEGVYQTSAEGKFLTVNNGFARILGYNSAQEILQTVTNISNQLYVYPRDRKRLFKIVEKYGAVTNFESQLYRKDGSRVWVSISSSAALDDQKRVLYYQGMVQDISEKKQLEVERAENVKTLRKALGATISAMAVMVETRDPYTAGHQRRVADLARAIATEMRLPSDQIDGVRMAGRLHDIGKISIPSEILTKPTQLTALEFNLIKTHPESGYTILKDIEFPWPIARIVLEHHERVNGSGYPRKLKENEILLESKIMAVADVVEAISSHRPYRAAHGIEAGLQEIADNKGVLYDAEVVDACLRLFREKSYTLAA